MSRTRHAQKEANKQGSKRYSARCKNNGTCPYCLSNRIHKYRRQTAMDEEAIQLEIEYEEQQLEEEEHDEETEI